MNYNPKLKLVWWATAGCASRSNNGIFTNLGEESIMYDQSLNIHHNIHQESIPHSHTQGIPPGCEDYKIICLIRNPYTRCVSHYIDLYEDNPKLKFDNFINTPNGEFDDYYFLEWEKIGRNPDYIIRLENPIKDWKKIPEASQIIGEDKFNILLEDNFKQNHYANNKPLDKYDPNGHQIVNRFFTQELADIVYEKLKPIFELGDYDKDSWK